MLKPDYYPLAQAALELKCSEDVLIQFAAKQKIQIHVVIGNAIFLQEVYDFKEKRVVESKVIGGIQGGTLGLDP